MKPLEQIFSAAVKSADPYRAVFDHGELIKTFMSRHRLERIVVIGFGKASCRMARALEDALGDLIHAGLAVTKNGHAVEKLGKIRMREASHPVPDESGQWATEEIIGLVGNDSRTLVVTLISGGGSSLLVAPWGRITLDQKRQVTQLLLLSGADITEINCVRKHLSRVKGGRLAQLIDAPVVSLILSDVIDDRLDVIASGPTAADGTTFADAMAVLRKYQLENRVSKAVLDHLHRGARGTVPETLKEGDPVFGRVENRIIGSNRLAIAAAARTAQGLAMEVEVLPAAVTGEAREAGRRLAAVARGAKTTGSGKPLCLISGGETTVTVTGKGKGGRNMELALAFAREIEGMEGISLLSAGTDGTDGPTDAAGAIVDGRTIPHARELGYDAERFLRSNDSYSFFRECGGLVKTGPTGTNVMDLQIMIVK